MQIDMHPIQPRKQGIGHVRKWYIAFRKYKSRYKSYRTFPETTVVAFTVMLLRVAYRFHIILRDSYNFSTLRNFSVCKSTHTYRPIQPLSTNHKITVNPMNRCRNTGCTHDYIKFLSFISIHFFTELKVFAKRNCFMLF